MTADYVENQAVRLSNAEEETLRLAAIIEQLRADQERMREALQKFIDHYPAGINPYLDDAANLGCAALSTPRQP